MAELCHHQRGPLLREIVTQIGFKVEKAHSAKSATNAESGTVVLTVQENSADRVPAWISLFGTSANRTKIAGTTITKSPVLGSRDAGFATPGSTRRPQEPRLISPSASPTKSISTSSSFKSRGSTKTGPDGSPRSTLTIGVIPLLKTGSKDPEFSLTCGKAPNSKAPRSKVAGGQTELL
jgi:hypothetical protein